MKTFGDGRDWFLEKKLGLFIHFGLYAIEGWHEQIQWRGSVPRDEYVKLVDRFDPQRFDPHQWLDVAESAGMEFVCITTKHHDGFCLWDTRFTDYNIMNTPYKKDIVKMLADACHERGIGFGIYYSLPDWHHRNYPTQGRHHEIYEPKETDDPDTAKYLEFVRNQVRELCTGYGRLTQFFWDVNVAGFDVPSLNEMIRELQPDVLINDRGPSPGDFATPERKVPDGRCFEEPVIAVQSMGRESWGYRVKEDFYTHRFLMRSIGHILAMGGNYLLNIGPKPDGSFTEQDIQSALAVGRWYHKVKEAFVDVEYSNVLQSDSSGIVIAYDPVVLTQSGNNLYIHAYKDLETSGIMLSPITVLPSSAVLLNTGQEVDCVVDLVPWRFLKTPCLRLVNLPVNKLCNEPLVVRLEFAEDAMGQVMDKIQAYCAQDSHGYGTSSTVGEILDHEKGREIIERYLPQMLDPPQLEHIRGLTLGVALDQVPQDELPDKVRQQMLSELNWIE